MAPPIRPPKLFAALLERIVPVPGRESLLGDFEETFRRLSATSGSAAAVRWYIGQVLKLLAAILVQTLFWSPAMFKNYVKSAFRNMQKHKAFAVINIAGLAVGLTCSILALLFVRYERSYDRYHKNAGQIHRVWIKQTGEAFQGKDGFDRSPAPLKKALTDAFPEIVRATRVFARGALIKLDGVLQREKRFFAVDPEFLEMFSFPLAAGDQRTALSEPYSVLLTEDAARKYFGRENPVGRILNIDERFDFKVTGILKNQPRNSHFLFDFLASFQTLAAMNPEDDFNKWNDFPYQTYIQLTKSASPARLAAQLPAFSKDKLKTRSDARITKEFRLQPLTDIHLFGHLNFEIEPNGDIGFVYILTAVGMLILLIACLNTMNLATAQSAQRAKEIAMRKVVGAERRHLIGQFLGESIVLAFLSLLLSLILVRLTLPAFSGFVGREIPFSLLGQAGTLGILAAVTLIVGLVAGSYPALVLSSFPPVHIFKRTFRTGSKKTLGFRRSLIVTQFAISIALIVCTLIVARQLRFIDEKKLGFVKEHVVTAALADQSAGSNIEPLRQALGGLAGVVDVTFSSELPNAIRSAGGLSRWEGRTGDASLVFYDLRVDENFFDFYGIGLVRGRKFSRANRTDASEGIILNQTAVQSLGWKEPLGRRLDFWGSGTVVGVADDFHFYSLHSKIEPLAIRLNSPQRGARYASIKIHSQRVSATLAGIERVFKAFFPAYPFNYSFLDERIEAMYREDRKMSGAFRVFTAMALFIACLGLFGLAVFAAEQRTKEIGIRKVLGSTEAGIVALLNREFVRWIVVAGLIAWPVAYFAMQVWLRSFAYRTTIRAGIFLGSTLLALVVAVSTVSLHAWKAARANPVNILKVE